MNIQNNFSVNVYSLASQVPLPVVQALQTWPIQSNTIYSTLRKCNLAEQAGQPPANHYWIAVTFSGQLELMLAITDSYYGTAYPAFLFYPGSSTNVHPRTAAALRHLVQVTAGRVPHQRVYSIFGPKRLATQFAQLWVQTTGINIVQDFPRGRYYDSILSYATMATLPNDEHLPAGWTIEAGVLQDIHAIAGLNQLFSNDSAPFIQNTQQAYQEAAALVNNRMVHVCKINGSVVGLVAYTRNCTTVATITKVMTHPSLRGRGIAHRLTLYVCRRLLQMPGRESVALFVGKTNPAARVYARLGFYGLEENPTDIHVEDWVEVGFDRDLVNLGLW